MHVSGFCWGSSHLDDLAVTNCLFVYILFVAPLLYFCLYIAPYVFSLGCQSFVNGLLADVLFYRQATYSENTKRSYRTHRKTYLQFCELLSTPPAPATTSFLCLYVAYLARFLLPQSVCLYLNYVGLLHRELGMTNPLLDDWVVSSVLRGLRRIRGVPPKPRLPLTIPLLFAIRGRLNLNCSKHASFWAICLVAFFGLFRKAHLLPTSGSDFHPGRMFTRSDFTVRPDAIFILVRWSKTIQMGQRTVTIPLVAAPGSPLCPVAAVSHAFSLCPGLAPSSQAFMWRDSAAIQNVAFTYKAFMTIMKQLLCDVGVDPSLYGTHSFRRGGATFALEAGVPLDTISLLGDWKSDAMYLYLHLPLSQRLTAQQTITSYLQECSTA